MSRRLPSATAPWIATIRSSAVGRRSLGPCEAFGDARRDDTRHSRPKRAQRRHTAAAPGDGGGKRLPGRPAALEPGFFLPVGKGLGKRLGLVLCLFCFGFSFGCGDASQPGGEIRPPGGEIRPPGWSPGQGALLITIDTLRADHVGAYARPEPSPERRASPTPEIDELARRGVLFENAVAPMPLTRPSHFSMMTSLYPREHGVVNNAIALPEEATTVAEILSAEGVRTAAFTSVVLLGKDSGAAQGFESFEHPNDPREHPAEHTIERALAWLRELEPEERFFLWVHVFDPHMPYAPPPAFSPGSTHSEAAKFASLDWPQFYALARRGGGGDVPAWALERARALYGAEVRYADSQIGKLLAGLEGLGRSDHTLVVLTADHGEAFENGTYFEHADSLFDGALRVPLIAVQPGVMPADERVATQASSLDVGPTLLEAFDVEGLEGPAGTSLRTLASTGPDAARRLLVQHPLYQGRVAANRPRRRRVIRSVAGQPFDLSLVDAERVGLVDVRWKLVRTGDELQLFDRQADEARDLGAAHPEIRDRLAGELNAMLAAHPLRLIEPEEINPELLEALRALGYTE